MGMIASGKSTYSKERAEQGAIIANDDSFVMAVHGGNYQLYDKSLKVIYKSVEHTIITHAIALGRDVIIDKVCMTRAARRRYIALAASLDVPSVVVKFKKESKEVHARRRFEHDSRNISYERWLGVAERHETDWEEPDQGIEGFDQLINR